MRAFNELEDESQVKIKPSITRKAKELLRSKQEQSYEWLFEKIVPTGSDALRFETLNFEVLSVEALECIMPILVELREEHAAQDDSDCEEVTGLSREQFIAKLLDVNIVPSYLKVRLLKAIETIKTTYDQE